MRARRFWLVGVLVLGAVLVAGVWWWGHLVARILPNYTEIEPGLYMGGLVNEPPPGTTAVLNLCETEDPYHVEDHRWVPIPDASPAPKLEWLREQVAFVTAEKEAGRVVYVHCRAGVSRSGMVVVAYFMAKNGWTRDEAVSFVRGRRLVLNPNPAFRELLLEWERELKKDGKSQ